MTTENTNNRRSDRHSGQSPKRKPYFLWIAFLSCVLIIVSGGTYVVYGKIQEQQLQEKLDEETTNLVAEIEQEQEKNGIVSEKKN